METDRAERREARHHTYTNRKPLADQDASKLERHIRQTSTWKREEAKYRRLSSKLRGELTRSKQHRFVRPPTPTHPAWDVGLPSAHMIKQEMEKANANECVLEDRGFRITRSTLKRLAWPATSRAHYLDTSLIDTYCALLTEHTRELREGELNLSPIPMTHIVSAMITLKYFPTACGAHDLDAVLPTAAIRNIPLDELDLLVFPLNPRGTEHWWSVTFDFRSKTIVIQNSSANPARNTTKYVRALKTLVEEAYRMYHTPIWTCTDWEITGPENSPKQLNAYDCGVFMCMSIAHMAHGTPTTITQDDMVNCRQHIAKRILANRYFIKEAHHQIVGLTTPVADGGSARKTQRKRKPQETPSSDQTKKRDTRETPLKQDTKSPRPRRRGPPNTTPYSDHSIKQRQRWHHASTHKPLSPYTWHRLPQTPQPHPTRPKMTTQLAPAQPLHPPTPLRVERVVSGDAPAPTRGGAGHW